VSIRQIVVYFNVGGKKLKIDVEAIGEILVPDSDSEADSGASDFEEYFEEESNEDVL
jgi:hypothetical protein